MKDKKKKTDHIEFDYLELSKRKTFNLQILGNSINHYFFLRCKEIILLESRKHLPKWGFYGKEGKIILMEQEAVSYRDRMLFLDNRLLLDEYLILQNVIFDDMVLNFYKIFDKRPDVFSIDDNYIKGKEKYRSGIPFVSDDQKKYFAKICEEAILIRKKIVEEIKAIRSKTIAHHDKDVYERNFLNSYSRKLSGGYENYNLSYEKIYSIIHQILYLFIKLEEFEYLGSPDDYISSLNFINIKFCKIFIRRNTKSNRGKIIFEKLEKEISETTKKLEKLFKLGNLMFHGVKGNEIITKFDLRR